MLFGKSEVTANALCNVSIALFRNVTKFKNILFEFTTTNNSRNNRTVVVHILYHTNRTDGNVIEH